MMKSNKKWLPISSHKGNPVKIIPLYGQRHSLLQAVGNACRECLPSTNMWYHDFPFGTYFPWWSTSDTHRGSLDGSWALFSNMAKGVLGRVSVILIDDVERRDLHLHGQTTDHLRRYRIQVLLSLVGRWCRHVVSLKTNLLCLFY